jgi:hypothetical protein
VRTSRRLTLLHAPRNFSRASMLDACISNASSRTAPRDECRAVHR